MVTLWGFSETLASATRLSWRRACCTSGFRASSKRVINKGKAVCRSHGARAQTRAQAAPLHPQGAPPRKMAAVPWGRGPACPEMTKPRELTVKILKPPVCFP